MRTTKRVFIAFAFEDRYYRDLLKEQSLNTRSPFEYTDMSVKIPWDSGWKERCRTRIKGCDGMIAMLSRNSLKATGQKWEIACAKAERVRLIGVYIRASDQSSPLEMNGIRKILWSWKGIQEFIDGL
jgi:hypothetical protein